MSFFSKLFSKNGPSGDVVQDRLALINLVNQAADMLDALRPKEAKALSQRALKFDPECAEALSNLGFAEIQLGNTDAAIQVLTKSLSIAPTNANSWHNLGEAYMRAGNAEKSLECNNRAIALIPGIDLYWLGKGNALAKLERNIEAVACFDKSIALHAQAVSSMTDYQFVIMKLNRDMACMRSDPQRLKVFLFALGMSIQSSKDNWKDEMLRAEVNKLTHLPVMDHQQVRHHDSFVQINTLQRNPLVVSFSRLNLMLAETFQDHDLIRMCQEHLKAARVALGMS